jgi:hypothetical protein
LQPTLNADSPKAKGPIRKSGQAVDTPIGFLPAPQGLDMHGADEK